MTQKPKLILGAGRKIEVPAPVPEPEAKVIPRKKEFVAGAQNLAPVTIQTFTLAGVTHSGYPFKDLCVDQEVQLVLDPYGQVVKSGTGHPDPYAVSIQDDQGKHIGYLKSAVAAVVYKAITSNKFTYKANIELIKGGYDGLNWGVDVLVKFYTLYKKDS